jgi:flagellin
MVVNSNMSSLNALNNLNRTNQGLSDTFGRISSGLRINKAADDAAGLAVAENLDAASRSLGMAKRNANDGIAVIQVAESATNEVSNILKRMRELAVQSSSETLESTERAYIQTEYTQLNSEIDRIADVTEFNGISLANRADASSVLSVQVGMNNTADDRIGVTFGNLQAATGLGLGSVNLSVSGDAQSAIATIDTALNSVNDYRSTYGAVENRLDSSIRSLDTYSENLKAAESQIRDADFAHEAAEMSKQQIMQQAGTAILAQANQINQGAVRLIG